MSNKSIYELDLHEEWKGETWHVTRVPGGWLYEVRESSASQSTFVPFSKEFDPDNGKMIPIDSEETQRIKKARGQL